MDRNSAYWNQVKMAERLEYDRYGGPGVMHLSSFVLPSPADDEVVVRVAAASINPMDWKIRSGDMKIVTGFKFPRPMGTDFTGIVEAVGKKVVHVKPGDAVMGTVSMKRSGAFAPRLITAQDLIIKKPDLLTVNQAASLPIAGVTAWQVLVKRAKLGSGQRLFINGASGSVGCIATAIALGLGAEVTGRMGQTSISSAGVDGLAKVLDHRYAVPEALNHSFDVVFDVHGSLSIHDGNRLIKPGGKVIDIVPDAKKFMMALFSPSRKVVFADVRAGNLQQFVDLAMTLPLLIPIAKTIELAEAIEVIKSLEAGNRVDGKVVITF